MNTVKKSKKRGWFAVALLVTVGVGIIVGLFLVSVTQYKIDIERTSLEVMSNELDRVQAFEKMADSVDEDKVVTALNYVGNGDFHEGVKLLNQLSTASLSARDKYFYDKAVTNYRVATLELRDTVKDQNETIDSYEKMTKKGFTGWVYQNVLRQKPKDYERYEVKDDNLHVVGKY